MKSKISLNNSKFANDVLEEQKKNICIKEKLNEIKNKWNKYLEKKEGKKGENPSKTKKYKKNLDV